MSVSSKKIRHKFLPRVKLFKVSKATLKQLKVSHRHLSRKKGLYSAPAYYLCPRELRPNAVRLPKVINQLMGISGSSTESSLSSLDQTPNEVPPSVSTKNLDTGTLTTSMTPIEILGVQDFELTGNENLESVDPGFSDALNKFIDKYVLGDEIPDITTDLDDWDIEVDEGKQQELQESQPQLTHTSPDPNIIEDYDDSIKIVYESIFEEKEKQESEEEYEEDDDDVNCDAESEPDLDILDLMVNPNDEIIY